jgi:hypothetical protein
MTTSTTDQDLAEIRRVHDAWMDSNLGLVNEKMVPLFADPGYLQYNLNGHTYRSVHEKAKLWDGFHQIGFDLADLEIVEEPLIYAEGDLGYLCAVYRVQIVGTASSGFMVPQGDPVTFRLTEVYRRDDGKGNPEWKIWHFHASPAAPATSAKYPQDEL